MAGILMSNDCAQHVQAPIEQAIVTVESSFNPYAIGVVNGYLVRQPRNKAEAIATAHALKAQGYNFSMGCRQVNVGNLERYGLTFETAFDAAKNSSAGSSIYGECLARATKQFGNGEAATRAALSCYYSGNFTTGQRKEGTQPSYVDKVLAKAAPGQTSGGAQPIPVVSTKPKSAKADIRKAVTPSSPTPEQTPEAGNTKLADWDVFNEL